jgi:hypothetical protein
MDKYDEKAEEAWNNFADMDSAQEQIKVMAQALRESAAEALEAKAAQYRCEVSGHFNHSQRKIAAERIAHDLELEAAALRAKSGKL